MFILSTPKFQPIDRNQLIFMLFTKYLSIEIHDLFKLTIQIDVE